MNAASYVSGAIQVRELAGSRRSAAHQANLRINQLVALLLLLLLSPLIALLAWMIWRRDGSPVIFAHYRVGREGKLFRCFKFRTMFVDAEQLLGDLLRNDANARREWERDHKLQNDPRITPVGHFLRRTSLDELPQLLNVLRGEMSVVGPRPITVAELPRYGRIRWHYLSVAPGMTGLWQVSGRNDLSYDQRVALDRRYVEQRSLWLDLSILCKTVGVVAGCRGAR